MSCLHHHGAAARSWGEVTDAPQQTGGESQTAAELSNDRGMTLLSTGWMPALSGSDDVIRSSGKNSTTAQTIAPNDVTRAK